MSKDFPLTGCVFVVITGTDPENVTAVADHVQILGSATSAGDPVPLLGGLPAPAGVNRRSVEAKYVNVLVNVVSLVQVSFTIAEVK
jgi:hypothetical protein